MTKAKSGTSFEAEYREYVKTTPEWGLVDDLVHLRKVIHWLPGSISCAATGFLIVVPVSACMTVLSEIFKGEPPETHLAQIWASGMLSYLIHCSFMFCVSMGFIVGQKYLIRYLWLVQFSSLSFLGVSVYINAPPFVIGFAVAGWAVPAFILSLARGKMFTAMPRL